MPIGPNSTVAEVKDWLVKQATGKGTRCPCCNRFVKINKRPLNSTMARAIIWLVNVTDPGEWFDVASHGPRDVIKTNQHTTLRHWGLIERKPSTTGTKKHSGIWRATDLARDFVHRRVSVAAYIYTYNNKLLRLSSERVTIVEALGTHFDYAELMKAASV